MPRTLAQELTYQLTLNGMLKMQAAILEWAKVNKEALHREELIHSLIRACNEEIQLHEVSVDAGQVIKEAAK